MKTAPYVIIIMLFIQACASSNKAGNINDKVLIAGSNIRELNKRINTLDSERVDKIASGQLDPMIDSVTRVYIKKLKDTVNAALNHYNAILNDKSKLGNQKATRKYLKSIQKQYDWELKNIVFLDDLFKASTFNRLNTTAFFAPGEYRISDTSTAKVIIQEIIKKAHDFSIRHADRKMKAMFIVLGYADEQEIGKGSDLYNELVSSTGTHMPDRKRLNTELSNRRAASIKNILREQYRIGFADNKNKTFSTSFIATGKGEELPQGKIKNYQPIDERRRIVLLYWSILPDLN